MEMSGRHSPIAMLLLSVMLICMALFAFYSFNHMMYGKAPSGKFAMFSFGKEDEQEHPRAAILYSEATAKYFGNEKNFRALIRTWADSLEKRQIPTKTITGRDLVGNMDSYDMLVLPLAVCLSDAEVQAVKNFVSRKGNGLIISGFAGARKENGDWRQVSLTSELLGGEHIEEADTSPVKDGRPVYMILDGLNTLAADIPPGFRLGVNTYDHPITATIVEPRTNIAAYWEMSGFRLYSTSAEKTAIVNGNYMGGRFVWMGFTLGSTVGDPASVEIWEKLLQNIIDYAAFRPIFSKELWPDGKRAAVVFAQDTEDKFDNASKTVMLFKEKKLPITFFCAPELVPHYPEVFKSLYSSPDFEIGLHGVEIYKHQSVDRQKERLMAGKNLLQTKSGQKIAGFRPPEAQYDENTMQALVEADFEYMPGDDITQASPSLLLTRKHQLFSMRRNVQLFVKFPKTGNDDYDILKRDNITDKAKMLERMKQDFDAVYKIGGLYYFSFHTQLMADKNIDVIEEFLDYVRSKDVWIANFGQVAEWWKRRMLVDMNSMQMGQQRYNLRITNNSSVKAGEINIKVDLPPGVRTVSATPEGMKNAVPEVSIGEGKAVLKIKAFEPDENRGFAIDLVYPR